MSRKFIRPSPEELQLQATKIGLPEREAEKFFNYFESKGWKVGKSPMQRWRSALANWKLNWEERRRGNGHSAVSASVQNIVWQKELEEIKGRMRNIRDSYSEHQSWAVADIIRWRELKRRKDELKKLLGIEI